MNRFSPLMILGLTLSVCLAAADVAHASGTTLVASGDTYVRRSNKGPYGDLKELLVKNVGKKDNTRKALIRFDTARQPENPFEAALELKIVNAPGAASFNVFGILGKPHSTKECGQNFSESIKYKWDQLDFLNDSDDGVDTSWSCVTRLGTFHVKKNQKAVRFEGAGLSSYIAANAATGKLTFLITRVGKSDETTTFASREAGSAQAPRLSWSNRDGLVFEGTEAPPAGYTGVKDLNGAIRIPAGKGKEIALRHVVHGQAKYENGRLVSITAHSPTVEIPGTSRYFDVSAPGVRLGYDYPHAFDYTGRYDFDVLTSMPLDPARKYFYLRVDATLAVDLFRTFTLASPSGGVGVIAIDPDTASLVVFLSYETPADPASSVASVATSPLFPGRIKEAVFGFSLDDGLVFRPYDNQGVEEFIQPFNGNLYVGGTIGLGLEPYLPADVRDKFNVDLLLGGNAMFDVDDSGQPENFMKTIGLTGRGRVVMTMNNGSQKYFSMTLDVANMTAQYTRFGNAAGTGGYPRLAFKGTAHSPQIPPLPFDIPGKVVLAGNVDPNDNGRHTFLLVGGKFMTPDLAGLGRLGLDGTVQLGQTTTFDGEVRIPGMTTSVTGKVTSKGFELTGKKKVKLSKSGWGVEVDVSPTIVIKGSGGSASLSANAKACINPGWGKECVKASVKEIKFKSDGHVRVCVGAKVAGQKLDHCFTI